MKTVHIDMPLINREESLKIYKAERLKLALFGIMLTILMPVFIVIGLVLANMVWSVGILLSIIVIAIFWTLGGVAFYYALECFMACGSLDVDIEFVKNH